MPTKETEATPVNASTAAIDAVEKLLKRDIPSYTYSHLMSGTTRVDAVILADAAVRAQVASMPSEETRMTGVTLIARERQRQVDEERWSPEHDDTLQSGALATAAVGYITGHRANFPISWRFKPTTRARDLVKAGALIAAEIDRLQRIGGSDAH